MYKRKIKLRKRLISLPGILMIENLTRFILVVSMKGSNVNFFIIKVYFGDHLVIDERLGLECLRIPHFYSSFYVYQYATGISAALAIAKRIQTLGQTAVEDFLSFLKLGGSQFPIDELRTAGVDILDNTPVLDIKPYLPYSDSIPQATGGFAPPPESGFHINFSDKALGQYALLDEEIPDLRAIITQVLENDPRPGYCSNIKDEPDRLYGIRLFDFDLKWRVINGGIQLIALEHTG